ncbi:cryptochrome/photolyase family protein [Nocardiopsis trehalosi]|uniref:cryptochrome/photolyase family protein n=1 Tax=Nocardiopsis trehalosi TaxID=109329 RepID=UPI00082A51AA|nr:deoxyribodipyrimidine photo-lyase [Nocardiopsis trehalosi]
MRPTIVLFTRDLRLHDHPALAAAVGRGAPVAPLFVVDPAIITRSARNRVAYLAEALADLRAALRRAGADLAVRRGDTVTEVLRAARAIGADRVHLSADVSAFATARAARLRAEGAAAGVEVTEYPGLTVVPPGALAPAGGGHYRVFTPYWRAWEGLRHRPVAEAPHALRPVEGWGGGEPPGRADIARGIGELSPERVRGGESAARARVRAWLAGGCADYEAAHDDLAAAATSRLSADLRFGCVSPRELAGAAAEVPGGGAAFVRQLAWRDFHHQVLLAFPDLARRDYRPRETAWRTDAAALAAWREGRTGVPIVDAGMRQLRAEGFLHNRARIITAAYLTRELGLDWRDGADHFHALLTDGDIADNYGNWQWVAGTGNDTRPHRTYNIGRQARRFDPDGDYVRRHVPELAGIAGAAVHTARAPDAPGDAHQPPLFDPD